MLFRLTLKFILLSVGCEKLGCAQKNVLLSDWAELEIVITLGGSLVLIPGTTLPSVKPNNTNTSGSTSCHTKDIQNRIVLKNFLNSIA